MPEVIPPLLLYLGVALGAVGIWMSLPRRRVNPQLLGGLVAAVALGLLLIGLGVRARDAGQLPNFYFWIFALIALGASLRVITHQRPVYAALYFILTILASAGLFLILSATFMAFALVIIYAGAILITYLFVIMLATQAPSEEDVEALADYDVAAREPTAAAVVGFALLAVLSTMVFTGVRQLPPEEAVAASAVHDPVLLEMPARVERALAAHGLLGSGEALVVDAAGRAAVDTVARTALVGVPAGVGEAGVPLYRDQRVVELPPEVAASNVESLAYDFLNMHPGAIEIAGIILLMAMLGAVVLSRRQVEMEEEAKRAQARRLALGETR